MKDVEMSKSISRDNGKGNIQLDELDTNEKFVIPVLPVINYDEYQTVMKNLKVLAEKGVCPTITNQYYKFLKN